MIHKFYNNNSDKTLVLFHGTGGNEDVLLPLARQVAHTMNVLSFRGDVVMDGLRRFCRVSEDSQIMDEEDMLKRIPNILARVLELKKKYNLTEMWALGFSNGANTISTMILDQETPFSKSILIRGMDISIPTNNPDLDNMEILIHSGRFDDIIPYTSGIALENRLKKNHAKVEHKIYDLDHRMRQYEIDDIKQWFDRRL